MALVVQTIGTASRTYSTLAAWQAGLPADLVTDGNSYEGDCYNDAEFTSSSNLLTLSGNTTDGTHTITLTTGAGQSFRDNASVQTNALSYNVSNGVGIRCTAGAAIDCTDNNVTFSNLQVSSAGGYANVTILCEGASAININNCILTAAARYTMSGSGGCTIRNSLLEVTGGGLIAIVGGSTGAGTGGPSLYFCTCVAPSDTATPPSYVIDSHYSTGVAENCAFFGCAAIQSAAGTVYTYTNCMTDVVGPPTGITGGKTYANQFVNTSTASADFREKTGADLQGAGTSDATNGATDIAGTARPQGSNWDIGAWELIVAMIGDTFLGAMQM